MINLIKHWFINKFYCNFNVVKLDKIININF